MGKVGFHFFVGHRLLQRSRTEHFFHADVFANVRQIGSIAAVDLASRETGYLADVGPRLYQGFLSRNLLVRPLGNTVYIMPPYCSGESELGLVYQALAEIAERL